MKFQPYIEWVREHIACEVYFIHDDHVTNGFVEYRNQGHVIYILGDERKMESALFMDILSHEAGHVLYNRRKMAQGMPYEQLVEKTNAKLKAIHSMLTQGIISDEEYERFYAAIEEEWESDKERERILAEWKKLGLGQK